MPHVAPRRATRHTRVVTDRIVGIALFLPVPLVLWLFTRAPLGAAASLALGVAVMVTHRAYARPFALTRASRRCLWCGGPAPAGLPLEVDEPPGRTSWRACCDLHRDRLLQTLATADRRRIALKSGILGGLVVFLALALLAGAHRLGPLVYADAAAFFKLAVALTVLPFGWLATRPSTPLPPRPRVPFPLHIQALIGTIAVLWLFRIVGLVWVVEAALHAAQRIG
jgi:hypothetical protein